MQLDPLGGDMDVHAVGVEIGDVGARHFLDDQAIAQHVEAEPPIALGRVAAVETEGADRLECSRRYLSLLLDRRIVRLELRLDEIAQAPLERDQAWRDGKVHCCSLGSLSGDRTRHEESHQPSDCA
jgi:hypothetical protein